MSRPHRVPPGRDSMVKSRKQANTVVTALPASRPADVPVVSALAEETIPDKAPEPVPSSPTTADGANDLSRPVRVYADGGADEQKDDSVVCGILPDELSACSILAMPKLLSKPSDCESPEAQGSKYGWCQTCIVLCCAGSQIRI